MGLRRNGRKRFGSGGRRKLNAGHFQGLSLGS